MKEPGAADRDHLGASVRIIVLGAGPTGLGAAQRLDEIGHDNWDVYERSDRVGGLASSYRDPNGFIWDHGGHVMFSHYPYVDRLVADTLGPDVEERHRRAWVQICDRLVPYPLQHNIHRLPTDVYQECLDGIVVAQRSGATTPASFDRWVTSVFGEGLARHFMRPYNTKVWAHPLETLSATWQGERVPEVDIERILSNERGDRDDIAWGPNAMFRFPRLGTGMLYDRIASNLGRSVNLGAEASTIDPVDRGVTFSDGSTSAYDHLVTTMPLPELTRRLLGCPTEVQRAADELRHTAGLFVGVGVRGEVPKEKCWVYFPDPALPFYRVTYLSNYSNSMTPGPGYFSLLAEISTSEHRPFDSTHAIERTLEGMVASGLLTPEQVRHELVSTQLLQVPYSYPVPTLGRDAALATIHEWLAARDIHSRGRFGAWRYEIGNTDHSVMMGVELVDRITTGSPETVWTS